MERGEVHRHVGPEVLDDPPRHLVELGVRVVQPGDQQRRELEPDVGLVREVLQGGQHRREMPGADVVVEALGEPLQVDVRRVHVREERPSGLRVHVAGRHRHRPDPPRAARVGHVDRVLEEDHRVVVGEGHRTATEAHRRVGERLGRGGVGQRVDVAGLRDVPVLAEAAGQVAAGGAEREHRRPRQEVSERLLLDRVDAEARGPPVRREHDRVALALPHEAEPALTLVQRARARADVAADRGRRPDDATTWSDATTRRPSSSASTTIMARPRRGEPYPRYAIVTKNSSPPRSLPPVTNTRAPFGLTATARARSHSLDGPSYRADQSLAPPRAVYATVA